MRYDVAVNMTSRVVIGSVVLALGATSALADKKPVAGLTVLAQSLHVQATTFHDDDWTPQINFLTFGVLPADGSLYAEYTKPDGTSWGRVKLATDEPDDRTVRVVRAMVLDADTAITVGGSVKFQIVLETGAKPTRKVLFAGSFTVDKLAPTKGVAKTAFVVQQDWLGGIARLSFDTQQHADNPGLDAYVWFNQIDTCQDVDATLSFGGKVIANTANPDTDKSGTTTLRGSQDPDGHRYLECRFSFTNVKGWLNGDYGPQPTWHDLSKHPGTYSLAITQHLVADRALEFSVGKDGVVAKAGAVEPAYHGYTMLVPFTVPGTGWAKSTGPFYGSTEKSVDAASAALYSTWSKRPKS